MRDWLGSTQGIATCFVFLSIFLLAWLVLRRRYIGMGFVLGYYGPGKTPKGVVVLSRLLNSPAHRAGVQKWDQVLEYDGRAMDFTKPQELTRFVKNLNSRLKVGNKVKIKLKRDDEIIETTLEASVIKGSIPVHLPQAFPSPNDIDYHDYHYGMTTCTRTGEWVPTIGMSDARVDQLLGRR